MSKKHIRIGCALLALVLVLSAGIIVLNTNAAEVLPMPTDGGLARMPKAVYDLYLDGMISEEVFAAYLPEFDFSHRMYAQSWVTGWSNRFTVTGAKNKKGLQGATIETIWDDFAIELRAPSSVFYWEPWQDFGFLYSSQLRNHRDRYGWWSNLGNLYEHNTRKNMLNDVDYEGGGAPFNGRTYIYLPTIKDSHSYGYYGWIVEGYGGVTMSDIAVYAMDQVKPGDSYWSAELVESGDEAETIYRIRLSSSNNEKLRPANWYITYEALATLQLDVTMVSNGRTYVIPAKAVHHDGKYIEYDFYGDVWPTIERNATITKIETKVVLPEGAEEPSYDVWDMYTGKNLTEEFGISSETPLTDYAGNSLDYVDAWVDIPTEMVMDREIASATRIEFTSSAIDSSAMGQEASYASQFLDAFYYNGYYGEEVAGDFLWAFLYTDEEMMVRGGAEAIGNVYLEWNIKDPDGNPVRTYLRTVYNYDDHSVLWFDTLDIHPAMTPQGQAVRPVRVGNHELLADRVGNHGLKNPVLDTGDDETSIHPQAVLYLDTTAPTAVMRDPIIRTKTTADGKTETVQLTIPFVVKDREKDEGAEGMISGASGTPAYLKLSDPSARRNVAFRYAVTQTTDFPADSEVEWKTGNMSRANTGSWGFNVGTDGENLYMHLELTNLTDYEFSDETGVDIEMWVQDIAGNRTKQYADILIPGVDNVSPTIELYNRRTENIGTGTGQFTATFFVADLNGISNISYRWVDSPDSNVAYTEKKYEPDANGAYGKTEYMSVQEEIVADGPVTRYLQVRCYDKANNVSEATYTFQADLTKAVSQYGFTGDINVPSSRPGVTVYAPVSVKEVDPDTAMSRVSIVREYLDSTGTWKNDIYFRLITAGEAADGVELFDTNATWYKVNEYRSYADGTYYDSVTKEEGTPGWASIYGNVDVYIGSCLEGFDLEQVAVHPNAGTNTSYTWEKIGTVAFAPKTENVHSLSYTDDVLYLYDGMGNATTGKWNADYTYRYAKFDQTMAGVRVDVDLANTLMSQWGLQDIDFENSYAVLVEADKDGKILTNEDGTYVEVSEHQPLSYSLTQTLTVPNADKSGLPFDTGVYTWVVVVAQKGGAVQTFDGCELYLLLDAANAVERFGVLSFDRSIFAADAYMDVQYVTVTEEAGENAVLPFINIGVAEPSQYLHEGNPEIQTVAGIQPYSVGVTNSLDSSYAAHFTITADLSKEEDFGTWLGQQMGGVKAIRFWNAASAGDYTDVAYLSGSGYNSAGGAVTAQFSKDTAAAKLDVNMRLGWFSDLLGHAVVDAETLAATPKGNFKVQLGENRVCYQLLMDNGVESPVYQFDLNLITDAPSIDVELDFGPAYIKEELWVDAYWNYIPMDVQYTQYTDLYFNNILSDYSGLEVYKVEYLVEDSTEYDIRKLTDEELTNGYRLTYGNGENVGLDGTNIYVASGDFTCGKTRIYFIVTDRSGNARTVFPLEGTLCGIHYMDFAAQDVTYEGIYTAEGSDDAERDGTHALVVATEDDGGYGYPEYIEITVDDREPARFDPSEELSGVNNAGIVALSSYSRYDDQGTYLGYDDGIFFVLPYDPEVAEGQEIAHTVHFNLVGNKDVFGETSYTLEKDFTVTGVNTKPAVTSVKTVPGCVYITHNVPVLRTDGTLGLDDRIVLRDNSLYGTDYEYTFTDVYGSDYTETIHIDEVTDPVITYSTTEPTTGPVTVTVTSANNLYVDEYALSGDISLVGNGTTKITMEFYTSETAEVFFDEDCTKFAAYVEVSNCFNTLEADPYIVWSYDAGDIQDGNIVYDEVTAYLMDRNGAAVIDPATGNQAKFVFFPGGETSYTFTGCYTDRGAQIPDYTAKLEVTLEPMPIEEADTFAPEVDVIGHYTVQGKATEAKMVYHVGEGRFSFPDYNVLYGEDSYQDNLVDMVANMGWAESYMFHLNIIDDSRVKLILRSDLYDTHVGYNTSSQSVDGVRLVGRTLEISKNAEFALYLVDEEGNTTPLYFKVTTLTESAPTPELAIVQSQDANGNPLMRVYMLPPQLDGHTNLIMTNQEARIDTEDYEDTEIEGEFDLFSDYFGYYYLEVSNTGKYPVYYSYDYRGVTYTGQVTADVVMPDMTAPSVKTSDWSANYYTQPTNEDVVLKLKLTKPAKNVVAVYNKDGTEYLLSKAQLEAYGMLLSYMDDAVTVFFEKNTTAMFADLGTVSLRFTGMDNNQNGYYPIPAVQGIDRTAPVISASVEYSTNRKNAVITLSADEAVLNQATGRRGESFTLKVFTNDTYDFQVVDLAGNRASLSVDVDGLITEELKITLSTSASEAGIIADPATYQADVGQTLYVRTNRASTVWIYGEEDTFTVPAGPDTWAQVTVAENNMGMHPSVVARDDYENMSVVQLAYIPVKDITAPVLTVHRQVVAVSQNATEEEIRRSLEANIIYGDEVTPTDMLKVDISFDLNITTGNIPVIYTVTDEAGNTATDHCWLRIRAGLVPEIRINGQIVDNSSYLGNGIKGPLTITVTYSAEIAEPYKLVYEKGQYLNWAKLKDGTWITDGYERDNSKTFTMEVTETGWYCIALITQSGEVYYFEVNISSIN